jgi:hypothetical protein
MNLRGVTVHEWTMRRHEKRIVSRFDWFSFCRVNTQLKMYLRGNYPWVNIQGHRVPIGKKVGVCRFRTCAGKVKETDLDSVGCSLWPGRSWIDSPRKPSMSEFKAYPDRKTQLAVGRFRACASDRSATDFDSVVITAWLRLIKMHVRRIHPWLNVEVYSNTKILVGGMFWTYTFQVADFHSVIETTWLRPVKRALRGNHPWMNP